MDFDVTEDQSDLRAAVREFLDKRTSEAEVRRVMETEIGHDPAVWAELAAELGLAALIVPEDHDGLGLGPVEVALVMTELGKRLVATPFLSSSVIATTALLASPSGTARDELLASLASGERCATLAHLEADGDWSSAAHVEATATTSGDDIRIDGTKQLVLDAGSSDVLLVTARASDGSVGLYTVERETDGVTVRTETSIDLTRRFATVTFAGAPATPLAADASGPVDEALALAIVALSAEQLGAAERCLDAAVEYANVREQFGRRIAEFQAVQHRCADILVEVELARTALLTALWAVQEGADDRETALRVAKITCSEALSYAAAENLHLHGGNGFTWEFPEQLYFRRARGSELLFGSPAQHRALLATSLGI